MPTRVAVDDDEQQIQDLIKEMRRLRSRLATTAVKGTHDEFTAAATPATTYQLTYIPLTGTCLMALNGHVQREGTDYTCDYSTGIVTVSATQAASDKITFRYLVTDWLIARSLVPETGLLADTFNRANSATTINPASDGGSYTVDTGILGITSNQGYFVSGGSTFMSSVAFARRDLGSPVQDWTITNARSTTQGATHLFVNFDPATSDAYVVEFDSSNSLGSIIRFSNSGITAAVSFTAWTGGSTTLRITSDGAGKITVYQGGTQVGQLVDTVSGRPAGTWLAFGTNTQGLLAADRWDNYSASG